MAGQVCHLVSFSARGHLLVRLKESCHPEITYGDPHAEVIAS